MSSETARKHRDGSITAISLLLLLAWDASGLDRIAMRMAGSASGFALRDHWLTSGLMHEGGRMLAWAMLAALVVNVWRPLVAGPNRAQRWRWLLVTLLCVVAVPALKRLTSTSCPWDLAEFGGTASYVSHWHFGVPDGGPGHCFPSGHAATAFSFLWGWFALRATRPALARAWLAAVLVLGAAFGTAQWLRGAHYPSHTLWTAWLCWTICVIADSALARQRALASIWRPTVAMTRPMGDDFV